MSETRAPATMAGFYCRACGFFEPLVGFRMKWIKSQWADADERHAKVCTARVAA